MHIYIIMYLYMCNVYMCVFTYVYIYIRMHMGVCMCVCVKHLKRCKTSTCCRRCASVFHFPLFQHVWLLRFSNSCVMSFVSHSRGPGTHDCLSWPTKTRQHGGENVPAIFHFPFCRPWQRAKPRTGMSI